MTTDIDALKEERWTLHLAGVPYSSWRLMPKWVRQEQLVRIHTEKQHVKQLIGTNHSLAGIFTAVVRRILR